MKQATSAARQQTNLMLQELGLPERWKGYEYLCSAIPYYAENEGISMPEGVYPYLCQCFGCAHPAEIEYMIRVSIAAGWNSEHRESWLHYFPYSDEIPSNSKFIAALAQRLK